MKVLIISGGDASEREISLLSAKEVKKALEKNGHTVKTFDFRRGYPNLKNLLPKFDVAFPVLHGEEGEGGNLQKFLSQQKIPYVGGNHRGFREGWYKIPFKEFCTKENIPTAQWKKVKSKDEIEKFGFPCVVKSSNGGSSLEVFILNNKRDLKDSHFQKLLKSDAQLFAEKLLSGTEITVGVLGDQVLPVIEIVPPENEWFNYKNKYSGETQELLDALSLNEDIKKKAQEIALKIHRKLQLGSLSRTDFIVMDNTPYTLEVNTIPGFTLDSLFPKAAGLSFEDLVEKLVQFSFQE